MAKLQAVTADAISGEKSFDVPQIEKVQTVIPVIGDEALIMHRFDEKSRGEMLAKQMGAARLKKVPKDPKECFRRSLHVISGDAGEKGAVYGFPSVGFKAAVINAAQDAEWKKTDLRRAFFVGGDLVPIEYKELRLREDHVRIRGTSDIRFRGMFVGWRAEIPVEFNSRAISIETLLLLFNLAGFGVGVGEWRPQKNGNNGRFHVAKAGEWEEWEQK